jgi:uncharacterized membrane protein
MRRYEHYARFDKKASMKRFVICFSLIIFSVLVAFVPTATAQSTVVKAVIFYSPTCPHCHKVITEDLSVMLVTYNTKIDWVYFPTDEPLDPEQLPPLLGAMGDRLQILYVDAASPEGGELFWAAIEYFDAFDRTGVPNLIVGENMLYGSLEIPERLPGIIEEGLAHGGIDWPPLSVLDDLLSRLIPFPTAEPTSGQVTSPTEVMETTTPGGSVSATSQPKTATPSPVINFDQSQTSVLDRIKTDLTGNILSIIVLIGLIVATAIALIRVIGQTASQTSPQLSVVIPLLTLAGIFVAGYLTFVEASGTEAVCGPVGDCNTVQQSKYAMLFGVIPVGGLGLVGYLLILVAWFVARLSTGRLSDLTITAIFGMTTFGALFSIYLTFLEPFVIGATCAWCLTSAIVSTALFWLSADPMIYVLEKM